MTTETGKQEEFDDLRSHYYQETMIEKLLSAKDPLFITLLVIWIKDFCNRVNSGLRKTNNEKE